MQCCFWQRCALTGLNAPEIICHHQSGGVLRSGHPYSISSACCANSVRNIPKPWSASPFKPPPWIWYSKPPPEKIAASDWKNGQTPGPVRSTGKKERSIPSPSLNPKSENKIRRLLRLRRLEESRGHGTGL